MLRELPREENRTDEISSEIGGGTQGSVAEGNGVQEEAREVRGGQNEINKRELRPHKCHNEREDNSRLQVPNYKKNESVGNNNQTGIADHDKETDTDTEKGLTDIEQSFIVLDSWTNEKESSCDAVNKPVKSPIRAVMRMGMNLAKNGQYELDLSDEKLQNNFVKWLDILADQNQVRPNFL